jgi:gas vesicle structural protein
MTKIEQPGLLEVLDRVLDKGIVVDAWIRFSLAGIDFLTVEARIVVASLETYLEYAGAIRGTELQAAPALTKNLRAPQPVILKEAPKLHRKKNPDSPSTPPKPGRVIPIRQAPSISRRRTPAS